MAEFRFNCPYYSDQFLELFSLYLISCSHERTVEEVLSCVRSLCNYAKKDFLELSRKDVDSYFQDMLNRKLSPSTIRIRRSRYSNLLRFVNEQTEGAVFPNYYDMLSFHAPEDYELSRDIVKNYVTEEQFSRIIRAANDLNDEMVPLVFGLSYVSAMSASEICEIRHDHISRDECGRVHVYIYDESFHTERTILLDEALGNLLLDYLSKPPKKDSPFIFLNQHGNPLTLRNINALFRKCCRSCGVGEEIAFKDLRSSAIVRMLSQQNSAVVAGDANLRTARMNLYKLARKNIAEVPSGRSVL